MRIENSVTLRDVEEADPAMPRKGRGRKDDAQDGFSLVRREHGKGSRSFSPHSKPSEITVFESYSHLDEKLRAELEKHLAVLKRGGGIKTWHDAKIVPGTEIDTAVAEALLTADLILLLISADFLNSDYCYCREMGIAMDRHRRGKAIVIPIILRPVDWHDTPFARLLALPKDAKAVTVWSRRDVAYVDIVKGIKRAVHALTEVRSRTTSNA
jgi:TIR domain